MMELADPGCDTVPAKFVAVQDKNTVPEGPAVYVMLLVVAPAVIVPPESDHEKVHPSCAGTIATYPAWPEDTCWGAVMVGVEGAFTTTRLAVPRFAALPEASVTEQERIMVPAGPAEKVMQFWDGSEVMLPAVRDHA